MLQAALCCAVREQGGLQVEMVEFFLSFYNDVSVSWDHTCKDLHFVSLLRSISSCVSYNVPCAQQVFQLQGRADHPHHRHPICLLEWRSPLSASLMPCRAYTADCASQSFVNVGHTHFHPFVNCHSLVQTRVACLSSPLLYSMLQRWTLPASLAMV